MSFIKKQSQVAKIFAPPARVCESCRRFGLAKVTTSRTRLGRVMMSRCQGYSVNMKSRRCHFSKRPRAKKTFAGA